MSSVYLTKFSSKISVVSIYGLHCWCQLYLSKVYCCVCISGWCLCPPACVRSQRRQSCTGSQANYRVEPMPCSGNYLQFLNSRSNIRHSLFNQKNRGGWWNRIIFSKMIGRKTIYLMSYGSFWHLDWEIRASVLVLGYVTNLNDVRLGCVSLPVVCKCRSFGRESSQI